MNDIAASVSPEMQAKLEVLSALFEQMPEALLDQFVNDLLALVEHGSLEFTVDKLLPATGTQHGAISLHIVGIDELITAASSAVKLDGIAHRGPLSC
jgi:hypothetical protein